MSSGVDGSSSTGGDTGSSGSSDPLESSGEIGGSSSDSSDESTGGDPACACDGTEALCESFEAPFDPHASPWAVPPGAGSVEPTVVSKPALCGVAALRTAVSPADLYSVANAEVEIDVTQLGPHRAQVSVWIEPDCLLAPTRVMHVEIPAEAGIWYRYALWIDADWIELRLANHASEYVVDNAVVPLTAQQWHTFELDFSVVSNPPHASVTFDGVPAIPDVQGPALSNAVQYQAMQALNLGIYRDDMEFENECAVIYDDVRVSTP